MPNQLSTSLGGTGLPASPTNYAPIFGPTSPGQPLQSGTAGTALQVLASNGAGALPTFQNISASMLPAGVAVKRSYAQTVSLGTGAGTFPYDDSPPQIGEGNEIITVSHTPLSSTNKLLITLDFFGSSSSGANALCLALFQDAISNALNAKATFMTQVNQPVCMTLQYEMTAGTTSAITFRMRAGSDIAGTLTWNGAASARKYGGSSRCSISVTEFAA